MATYKPYRKTTNGKEEIKIPYSVLSNPPVIPTKVSELTNDSGYTTNKGTVTSVAVKMNGATKGTVTSSGTIDLGTVLTDASKFATSAQGTKADNALSLDGGTIKKSKTIKMDASANSDGANIKWGTVNSKNPYIGYASDQVDGTFVVGSLLGTNYASGLAIGGGSGNLLWKGTKVATTSDIPNVSGKANLNGGNNWTGTQQFNGGTYYFATASDRYLTVEDEDGNAYISMNSSGFYLDFDELGNTQFMIAGNPGTSGQVITSQGAGKTPQWTTPTKGTVTQVKVNGTTKSPNAAGLVDLGTIGGGGGGSTAWSSGTSGSVKLPSAGLYVVVSDDNFTFVVYWNGSGPAYSNITYRSRNDQWVQTEIIYNGVIYVYAYKLNPLSKTLQNETIKYRKIGEA